MYFECFKQIFNMEYIHIFYISQAMLSAMYQIQTLNEESLHNASKFFFLFLCWTVVWMKHYCDGNW